MTARPTQAALLALLLVLPAHADGPSAPFVDDKPCDVPFPSFDDWAKTWSGDGATKYYALAQRDYLALCGALDNPWAPPVGKYSDAVLLRFFSNGGGPHPAPAPVPIPPTALLLLGALAALVLWRKHAPEKQP